VCDAASTTITATTTAVTSAVTTQAEAAEAALIEAVFGYIGLGVIVIAIAFYCIRRTCCKRPDLHGAGEHHANRMLRHVSSQDKVERKKVRLQTPPPLCRPLATRVYVL
jgi:ABC-type nickel/cobalt efflux system permease component RcnA